MASAPASNDPIAEQFFALERALARRDSAGIPGGLESLIDAEFVEFGASGRVWDRAAIVRSLAAGRAGDVEITEFAIRRLAADVVLATYRSTEASKGAKPRRCLRSSIWVRRGSRWTMRFHQGTPLGDSTG